MERVSSAEVEFTIRRATIDDVAAVHRIERDTFPQPWSSASFRKYLGDPGFLVAECGPDTRDDSTSPVGYVVADSVPDHPSSFGHIKALAVAGERRNLGIGTSLLRRALSVLDAEDVRYAKLEVRETNVRAFTLYRRFGFVHRRTIPAYYDDGEDALVMVRSKRAGDQTRKSG